MGTPGAARPAQRTERALARRERKLAALASRQHGVIARRQLLDAGLSVRTIRRRVEAGRLHSLHREVYAFGHEGLGQKGRWMAAVLAGGEGALLSHRSAGALWGLMPPHAVVEVTAARGLKRRDVVVHEGGIDPADRTERYAIPVTTVARTLLDLAEVVDEERFGRVFEEADRLRLLATDELEAVCARGLGRHGLKPLRRLIEIARAPSMSRSELEGRFLVFCRDQGLPPPATNVLVLGHEVDALWPEHRLIVEVDGFSFHGHRAAFERDRARDAARQVAGYRVVRVTYRRLQDEAARVADELRALLAPSRDGRAGT